MLNKDPGYSGPANTKQVFTNSSTHPLVLDLVMVKEFGPEYLAWEASTCWEEIRLTWGTTISESSRNKLQAVRTCHTSDQPYERWEVFEKISIGLSGMSPRFDLIQRVSLHSIAAAIEVLLQVKDKKRISEEVYKYIAASMLDDGLVYGPGPLEPSNRYLTKQVGPGIQKSTKRSVLSRVQPSQETDIQTIKSLSIKDFVEHKSRVLLSQLKVLFP